MDNFTRKQLLSYAKRANIKLPYVIEDKYELIKYIEDHEEYNDVNDITIIGLDGWRLILQYLEAEDLINIGRVFSWMTDIIEETASNIIEEGGRIYTLVDKDISKLKILRGLYVKYNGVVDIIRDHDLMTYKFILANHSSQQCDINNMYNIIMYNASELFNYVLSLEESIWTTMCYQIVVQKLYKKKYINSITIPYIYRIMDRFPDMIMTKPFITSKFIYQYTGSKCILSQYFRYYYYTCNNIAECAMIKAAIHAGLHNVVRSYICQQGMFDTMRDDD